MGDERETAREEATQVFYARDQHRKAAVRAAAGVGFRAGFDAGADWQRELDQARPNTDDCLNECAQDYLKTLLKRDRGRIAKLESDLRIERGRVEGLSAGSPRLWECPGCGFGFDAQHTDQDGGYSCPVCAKARLEKALAVCREALRAALEHDRLRHFRYVLLDDCRFNDALATSEDAVPEGEQ